MQQSGALGTPELEGEHYAYAANIGSSSLHCGTATTRGDIPLNGDCVRRRKMDVERLAKTEKYERKRGIPTDNPTYAKHNLELSKRRLHHPIPYAGCLSIYAA